MSEFVKPKRVFVTDSEYISGLINAGLVKDLHDNEEVCQVCHGTGLVIQNNVYGLSEDPDRSVLFPYQRQALSFCQHCYNGVVSRCKLCGEIIPRGRLKHDCEVQREIDRAERRKKEAEEAEKAPWATSEMEENAEMFCSDCFSRNEGYFADWDEFFDDWECEHEPDEPKPDFVWTTVPVEMRMDAVSILENATADMYEDAMSYISDDKIKELQAVLDDFAKTCGVGKTYYKGRHKVKIPWADRSE